jgi:NADPH-dependent curcumin reductase CurA
MTTSREIRLAARPSGAPQPSDFELVEVDLPEPGDGEVLIRNACVSVDPYMRGRMNDARSYVPPFQLGEPLSGGAVGQVVVSHNDEWPEGSWVVHSLGWREAAVCDGTGLLPVDPSLAPVSTALGVLGMTGLTAYVGLLDVGRVREGETVFVSGAAGAVGSVAGQIAKLKGCRVIGSAGTPDKVAWVRELGFDEVFDYRETEAREALAEGIDVYFDNVGGATLEAAIGALRRNGRVVACGAISQYNATEAQPGPRNMFWSSGAADRRLHRLGPLRPVPGLPRGHGWMGARGEGALPGDDRGRDRERTGGVHGAPAGRQRRQDARQGGAGAVSWRCKLLGHKVPEARRFFLTGGARCARTASVKLKRD